MRLKTLLQSCLAAVVLALAVTPAFATKMIIQATSLKNWRGPTTGVYLEIYADQAFVETTGGTTIQPGAPGSGTWYKRYPCTVTTSTDPDTAETIYSLNIPSIFLESTTNPTIGTRSARYNCYFAGPNGFRIPYQGFMNIAVPASFAHSPTTMGTWEDIAAFNTGPQRPQYDLTYYSREETNRLIAAAIVGTGGLTTLNGLGGAIQTFGNDTNVTIVSSGTTHTLTWAGTLSVDRGGIGTGTLTSNGVLYGNGTGAVTATAQGATNSILVASGGAPSFSQTPTINTSLTIGTASAQTGSLKLANSTNANLVTIQPGVTSSSYTWTLPLAQGAANSILANNGSGTLSWTTTPTLGSTTVSTLTDSALTSGRVVIAGTSGLLADDSNFLWDATNDRLSIGTTDSTNSVNLPNAGYLSGRGSVAAAQVKIASVSDQTQYTGVATSTTVDAITLGSSVPVAHVYTDGGATALKPLAPDNQIRAAGIRVGFGTAGAYNDSSSSNIFHFSAQASNIGSANTVAGFFEAQALGSAANVWAINPVAYVNVGGTTTASAIMLEGNFGALGVSPNQAAYGIVLASNVDALTPAGTVKSFFQMQANTATSGAVNGIVFSDGTGQAVTNAQIYAQGTTATYAGLYTLSTYATGFDFAQSTFSSGSQIRLANGGAASSGIRAQNNANSASFNVARMTTGDYLEYGDGNSGLTGIRFLASAGSSETLRMLGGSSGLPGNAGFNQSTPTAQIHETAIGKRAVTGTDCQATAGAPGVSCTGSTFTTELAPGSTVLLSTEPSTPYTVKTITSDTALVLTQNVATNTPPTGTTILSDYRPLLVEAASGQDWLEVTNQHVLKITGDSTYSDLRGMISLVALNNSAKRLTLGINDASSYAYISSFQESVGWKPLFLQAGAAGTAVGGVVIGTASPSSAGAMLKVEGAQTNPGANNVGSEFNNFSTSNAYYQKVSAQYLSAGAWYGPNIGLYSRPLDATDTAGEAVLNVPIAAFGGKNFFGPDVSQVSTAPANVFTAVVDIYGVPTDTITLGTDTAQIVNTLNTVAGVNTTWNTVNAPDWLQPGDAVWFASEPATAYEIATVSSNTAATLTSTVVSSQTGEARKDPYLLRLRNSAGSERLRVESNGKMVLGGVSTEGVKTKTLTEGAATSFVQVGVPQGSNVAGYVEYTCYADDGTDFQARTGIIPFSIVNKAGTETVTVGTVTTATEVVAVSSGTLTLAITGDTTPTDGVNLQANATSSLAQTTLAIKYYVRITSGAAKLTPQ